MKGRSSSEFFLNFIDFNSNEFNVKSIADLKITPIDNLMKNYPLAIYYNSV